MHAERVFRKWRDNGVVVGWHGLEQRLAVHVGRASRHVLQFVRVLYLYSAMHTENHCQDFAAPRPCSRVNVLCSCAGFLCACVLRVPG